MQIKMLTAGGINEILGGSVASMLEVFAECISSNSLARAIPSLELSFLAR